MYARWFDERGGCADRTRGERESCHQARKKRNANHKKNGEPNRSTELQWAGWNHLMLIVTQAFHNVQVQIAKDE